MLLGMLYSILNFLFHIFRETWINRHFRWQHYMASYVVRYSLYVISQQIYFILKRKPSGVTKIWYFVMLRLEIRIIRFLRKWYFHQFLHIHGILLESKSGLGHFCTFNLIRAFALLYYHNASFLEILTMREIIESGIFEIKYADGDESEITKAPFALGSGRSLAISSEVSASITPISASAITRATYWPSRHRLNLHSLFVDIWAIYSVQKSRRRMLRRHQWHRVIKCMSSKHSIAPCEMTSFRRWMIYRPLTSNQY